MKQSRLSKRSLRISLLTGVVAMLLPWVMFILVEGQLLFPRIIDAFDDVVKKTGTQMHAIMELHERLQRSATQVNEYLIDADIERRQKFVLLSRQVDQKFDVMRRNYTESPLQLQQLDAAREAWQEARESAGKLLALQQPVGNTSAALPFRQMNHRIDKAHGHLDQIHGFVQQRASRQLEQAHEAARQIRLFNAIIFGLAMIIAAISGYGLARAVLTPLRTLEEGANRLGAGDLAYRVEVEGEDELQQLAGAFNSMAEQLQKSQLTLEEMSARDGLTGLYNHKEFLRRLEIEIERHQRYGRPFSVLMLDLDYFKQVNDTHGHQAGDEVLRAVGAIFQAEVRPTDQVARYGGEEFAIILAETSGPGALAVAERVCAVVAERAIEAAEGVAVSITVSIGVASYPEDAGRGDLIMTAADKALYAAKNAGRNRAARFSDKIVDDSVRS